MTSQVSLLLSSLSYVLVLSGGEGERERERERERRKTRWSCSHTHTHTHPSSHHHHPPRRRHYQQQRQQQLHSFIHSFNHGKRGNQINTNFKKKICQTRSRPCLLARLSKRGRRPKKGQMEGGGITAPIHTHTHTPSLPPLASLLRRGGGRGGGRGEGVLLVVLDQEEATANLCLLLLLLL